MATRDQFQSEMEEINEDIIALANLSGKALSESIEALYHQDMELANQIIAKDIEIDRKEMEINDKTILLIAKQQPVATDLRRLIIAVRIVTDIERMADNAKNIAKSTIYLGQDNKALIPEGLQTMHDLSIEMLQTALNAFKYEDITIAGKLSGMDDKVDKLYKLIISEMLGETATNADKIQYVMQIAFCARYLERFADHITNIGESILFLVKGENYNLN
ncbi:phosphate transport system regulatory protein PhoU [Virgibacillus profundi]|uniref:Phosphate-specific transport system accessory protein PhoU n=1 Tax=Virgibacillus profundi TaxID=2024555 RepID=A0A2A2ICM4_9BACI|nr:phosphate signaling complex protein PhoU [Virgibacillus profundi]PAV29056.1 phosphate transport system regulatory protein PhoU [Virgibacillus profundi]PXY53225.1 phosphate transport system regulatory protein PhoU [Virgibacillus profundi]